MSSSSSAPQKFQARRRHNPTKQQTPDGNTSTWRRFPENSSTESKPNENTTLEKALSTATTSQSFKRPRIGH
jgi:hypothetical protein